MDRCIHLITKNVSNSCLFRNIGEVHIQCMRTFTSYSVVTHIGPLLSCFFFLIAAYLTWFALHSIFSMHTNNFISYIDRQPPSVVYCPDNIYQLIVGSTASVTWKLPEFSDNVKVVKVTSTKNPGDTFQLGSTNVKYDSFDDSGNTVSCTFSVTLKGECVDSLLYPNRYVMKPVVPF